MSLLQRASLRSPATSISSSTPKSSWPRPSIRTRSPSRRGRKEPLRRDTRTGPRSRPFLRRRRWRTSPDSETFGAYAGLPSPSFAGRVYEATDGLARSLDTGSAFLTFGPVWPLTPFAQAGFSYVNQGSATVTTANGISVLSDQGGEGASDSIRLFVETIPTAPYTLTVCFIPLMSYLTSGGSCGLVLRDSSSSKLIFFLCTSGFNVQVLQFTNPTTFSASAVNATFNGGLGGAVWLRIKDDNTNRKYSVSADGFNFVQILSETRTTFITANQIGIAMNNRSSSGGVSLMSVLSYLPTQP